MRENPQFIQPKEATISHASSNVHSLKGETKKASEWSPEAKNGARYWI